MATEADQHLPAFDNTKLTAINTCPTWGILRYVHHKTFATRSRAMALEAGSACHEVFAAVRLWQLVCYDLADRPEDFRNRVLDFQGQRLFGDLRWPQIREHYFSAEDERTRCLNFCLEALFTSGFYDDPSDRRRTLSNLEEACILYIDRWDWHRYPIWIRDRDDPESDVGIEIAFDLVISFELLDGSVKEYRFIGKFDGLHYDKGQLAIGENKTGARLDEAWEMSFEMSSQVTGYSIAAYVWTGMECRKGVVFGLQIPLPRTNMEGGFKRNPVTRYPHMFERWFKWFWHTVQLAEQFPDPVTAPRYTHSCNRYFRPCSFIPFCSSEDEDARQMMEEMVVEEWSPLHEANGGD